MRRTQKIHDALERWLRHDPGCRAKARAIRKAQTELRRAMTDGAWDLYLALEELGNARHVEIIRAAIDLALRDERPPRKRAKTG